MSSRRSVGSSRSEISSAGPPCPPGCQRHTLVGTEAQLVVELQTADAREVVALGVEEQVLEEVGRGVERRRIAGAQATVDVDDRLFLGRGLVGEQRVPHRRAGEHRVQVEQLELVDTALAETVEVRLRNLLVALDDDFAGRLVDDVDRRDALHVVFADQVLEADRNPADPGLVHPAQARLVELAVLAHEHVARVVLHVVGRALAFQQLGIDLLEIARLLAVEFDLDRLGLVEVGEQLLGVVAERLQQHRGEDLPAPIDARVEHVLVVELEVEPRTAVRDHAAGEQLLAGGGDRRRSGRVEEDAGRAMELRDDHALGAVDDEGAVVGHDRDLPEVDLLLLHVADRLRALGVVPGDESDRHLERRGVGHAALQALLHVVLGLLEHVADELQRRGVVEVLDREDRVEDGLQAGVLALLRFDLRLQEAFERLLLDLDQVGDLEDPGDLREILADPGCVLGELDLGHDSDSPSNGDGAGLPGALRLGTTARDARLARARAVAGDAGVARDISRAT